MADKEMTTFTEVKPKIEEEVKKVVESILKGKVYNQKDSDKWVESVTKETIVKIKDVTANFKYIAACVILEKKDAGLSISSSCFWDSTKDGSFTTSWQNDTILCVVNIYALAI